MAVLCISATDTVGVAAVPQADSTAMTKIEITDISFLFIFSPFSISLHDL
jgi:hypothetical protein